MNKISKYLLTGIAAIGLTACADLDLNPLANGSSENWYHDETEIEMALNDLWRPDFFPIDGFSHKRNYHFPMGDIEYTLDISL